MTVTIQLFYEPDKFLVEDFQLEPFESHDRIIQNVRQRFGVPFVTIYTTDSACHHIVIDASASPRPYSPYGLKLCRGEEAADVHPSLPKKPWAELTEVDKKNHIISLGARKPETRNTLRIAESYPVVTAALDALKKANAQQLGTTYTSNASRDKIAMHWGVPFILWLPEEMKPKGTLLNYQWDLRMLASLGIQAKATPGQGHIIKDIIKDIVEGEGVLTEQVVLHSITRIYERAGLIASQMTKEEKKKTKASEHTKRNKAAKKAEDRRRKEVEALDALGEDAAQAAYPKGRKMEQADSEVDEIAEQLGRTQTSRPALRIVMEEDESD